MLSRAKSDKWAVTKNLFRWVAVRKIAWKGFPSLLILFITVLFGVGCTASQSSTPLLPPSALSSASYPDKYNNSFVQGGYVYLFDGKDGWKDVTPYGTRLTNTSSGLRLDTALFIDQNTGWVISTFTNNSDNPSSFVVYRTTDGGNSWISTTVSVAWCGGVDIDFINTSDGWLLVHTGVAAGSEGISVMKTTDGGATWNTVSVTGLDGTPGSIGFVGDKTGIRFCDTNSGWITGTVATGAIYLYATHDCGQTWNPVDIPTPGVPINVTGADTEYSYYQVYLPVFYSGSHGVLPIGESDSGPSPNYTYLGGVMYFYTMDNGGDSWVLSSRIPLPAITD